MPSSESKPPTPLDALLARQIEAPADFAARLQDRLHRPGGDATDELEETLERLLAAWPAAPSAHFTADTLARLHADRARPTLVAGPWRFALALTTAAAAVLALTLLPPPTAPLPRERASPVVTTFQPAPSPDPEAAQILALAKGLDRKSSWLLRANHFETIATAYR